MKHQFIRDFVDIFESFVRENFHIEGNTFICNNNVFKKLLFENKLYQFLNDLKKYYFLNKYHYIERNPCSYSQFTTILRQICKRNDVVFYNKIKYTHSIYDIEYYIVFTPQSIGK